MAKEVATGRDPNGTKVAAAPPPPGVQTQLAALTVAVRRMGDVLEEHTRQLRKLNEIAGDADGDKQLLDALRRIQETLSVQTEVLNALVTRPGSKPGAARAS